MGVGGIKGLGGIAMTPGHKDLLRLRRQGCGLSAQVGLTCGLLMSIYLPGHLELLAQAPKDPYPGY